MYSDCVILSVEMDTYLYSHRFVMPTAVGEQNEGMTLPENVEPMISLMISYVNEQLTSSFSNFCISRFAHKRNQTPFPL